MPSACVFGDDNINGDLILSLGDQIDSDAMHYHSYTVCGLLGSGSFAQVILAAPKSKGQKVAVKVVKALPECTQQSREEIAMIVKLQKAHGSGKRGIVAMLGEFTFKSHLCIVFERLGSSLLDVLASRSYHGLGLAPCATVAADILDAVDAMAEVGIIHCDLKPENILLRGSSVEDGIKVVDFGSACIEVKQRFQTYFQSRFYRAPEVIMGADYTRAVDMWSFGCIIVELALGKPVFSGGSEFDHLNQINALVGPLPPTLLARSRKLMDYYEISGTPSHGSSFTLKQYEVYSKEKGLPHKPWKGAPQRWPGVICRLRDVSKVLVLKSNEPSDAAEEFADFLSGCLTIDPNARFDTGAALAHPFIVGNCSLAEDKGLASAKGGGDRRMESGVAVSTGGGGAGGAGDRRARENEFGSLEAPAETHNFDSLSLLLQSPPRGKFKMKRSQSPGDEGDDLIDRESPQEPYDPGDDDDGTLEPFFPGEEVE
eukprot:gene2169-25398_t